jgi:hypothetical protein
MNIYIYISTLKYSHINVHTYTQGWNFLIQRAAGLYMYIYIYIYISTLIYLIG